MQQIYSYLIWIKNRNIYQKTQRNRLNQFKELMEKKCHERYIYMFVTVAMPYDLIIAKWYLNKIFSRLNTECFNG